MLKKFYWWRAAGWTVVAAADIKPWIIIKISAALLPKAGANFEENTNDDSPKIFNS